MILLIFHCYVWFSNFVCGVKILQGILFAYTESVPVSFITIHVPCIRAATEKAQYFILYRVVANILAQPSFCRIPLKAKNKKHSGRRLLRPGLCKPAKDHSVAPFTSRIPVPAATRAVWPLILRQLLYSPSGVPVCTGEWCVKIHTPYSIHLPQVLSCRPVWKRFDYILCEIKLIIANVCIECLVWDHSLKYCVE